MTTHSSACTCREHPLDASMRVRDARDAYLAENGFTVEAYEAPTTDASVLGIKLKIPNTPRHRWAIKLHDLHHVATGFGTDLAGEGEISAWEVQRGLGPLGWYVAGIIVTGTLAGLLVAPRRFVKAWRAPGDAPALWATREDYDTLLDMTVGDLRTRLGLPRDGLVRERSLHAFAPVAGVAAAAR